MARSTYIYLVGPDHDGSDYAFTVKHEAQSFVSRHQTALTQAGATARRLPDSGSYGASGRNSKTWTLEEFTNG